MLNSYKSLSDAKTDPCMRLVVVSSDIAFIHSSVFTNVILFVESCFNEKGPRNLITTGMVLTVAPTSKSTWDPSLVRGFSVINSAATVSF